MDVAESTNDQLRNAPEVRIKLLHYTFRGGT